MQPRRVRAVRCSLEPTAKPFCEQIRCKARLERQALSVAASTRPSRRHVVRRKRVLQAVNQELLGVAEVRSHAPSIEQSGPPEPLERTLDHAACDVCLESKPQIEERFTPHDARCCTRGGRPRARPAGRPDRDGCSSTDGVTRQRGWSVGPDRWWLSVRGPVFDLHHGLRADAGHQLELAAGGLNQQFVPGDRGWPPCR